MNITTVLLDIDGTLVDSNDAHAAAWQQAFAASGRDVTFDRIRPLLGMGGDMLLPAIDPALSSTDGPGKTISAKRKEIFLNDFASKLRATPGARDLLAAFRQRNITCQLATSASQEELTRLVQIAGIEDLIDGATTSEDAPRSKPDPGIVRAALDRVDIPAAAAVMLGDTRFDIEAAAKAEVPTIALRTGGASDADLAGACAIFDDPADLLAALSTLTLDSIVAGAK